MMPAAKSLRIEIPELEADVSALWQRADDERALLVFAHGAGAGMEHGFMQSVSAGLAKRCVATLRYQFPYTEQGKRAPSRQPALLATVRAAVARGAELAGDRPLFAGGKSMGGRMTSLAVARDPAAAGFDALRGILFFGFPLHAPGKTGEERADHLQDVDVPLLFLQGTRDKLAELPRLEPVCRALGWQSTLHIVEGGDHSFHVLKRSGRTDDEVLEEITDAAAQFVAAHAGDATP